jgi:hypothetical protein
MERIGQRLKSSDLAAEYGFADVEALVARH